MKKAKEKKSMTELKIELATAIICFIGVLIFTVLGVILITRKQATPPVNDSCQSVVIDVPAYNYDFKLGG